MFLLQMFLRTYKLAVADLLIIRDAVRFFSPIVVSIRQTVGSRALPGSVDKKAGRSLRLLINKS
jgi:hypothetical protein